MQIRFTRQRVNCDHKIWIIRKNKQLMSDSESIDLDEISELIGPISPQGMFDVSGYKLVKRTMFVLEFAL